MSEIDDPDAVEWTGSHGEVLAVGVWWFDPTGGYGVLCVVARWLALRPAKAVQIILILNLDSGPVVAV
jgi:hypothetical protein